MKRNVTISLNEELLEQIDRERGLITRSAYVEDILKKWLEKEVTNQNE